MRRAQAAVEYLLMITVALMMVALVIKYVKQVAEQTGQTINSSASQLNEYVNKSWENVSG